MLTVILVAASIQLAAGLGCYALAKRGTSGMMAAVFIGGIGFLFFASAGILTFVQFVGLLVLGMACLAFGARRRTFALAGGGLTLLMFVAMGLINLERWSHVRAEYPIRSLNDRLAYETKRPPAAEHDTLDDQPPEALVSERRLVQINRDYMSGGYRRSYFRNEALRTAHASRVEQFANTNGFGVGRMRTMGPHDADEPSRNLGPIAQPAVEPALAPGKSAGEVEPAAPLGPLVESDANQKQLHVEALADFGDPGRFGWVQDRDHVAGFEPHRFSQVPAAYPERWHVRKLELVSLLKHQHPEVYVSENLPDMRALQEVPTRPLDVFERQALDELRAGEDLAVEPAGQNVRMLGAVRAGSECVECHAVKPGALLGAFSYELDRGKYHTAPAADRPSNQPAF